MMFWKPVRQTAFMYFCICSLGEALRQVKNIINEIPELVGKSVRIVTVQVITLKASPRVQER